MDTSFEDQIRECAYHLWLAGGRAEGLAHEHWACAEQAVRGETRASAPAEPAVIMKAAEAHSGKAQSAKPKSAKAGKGATKSSAAKSSSAKSSEAKSSSTRIKLAAPKTSGAASVAH